MSVKSGDRVGGGGDKKLRMFRAPLEHLITAPQKQKNNLKCSQEKKHVF